ncbi:MAG: hypothetical protein ACHWZW_11575 [Spirulina sp.]
MDNFRALAGHFREFDLFFYPVAVPIPSKVNHPVRSSDCRNFRTIWAGVGRPYAVRP